VHLSVSILAAFTLADVLAVLQVLWYYSLFYDRRFSLFCRQFPTEEAFLLYRRFL
jgi:Flp pilus assembly protein TadB